MKSHYTPRISGRLTDEDRAIEERLKALKGTAQFGGGGGSSSSSSGGGGGGNALPSDTEMMNKLHEIRGVPPPRPAPPGGFLPPPQLSPEEEANALLAAANDAVRLEGGANLGYDDATLAALAAGRGRAAGGQGGGEDEDAPLVGLSKAELGALSLDAKSALRDARKEMPKEEAKKRPTHAASLALEEEGKELDEAAEAEALLLQLQDELALEEDEEEKKAAAPLPPSAATSAPGGGGGGVAFPSVPTSSVLASAVPSTASAAAREEAKEQAEMSRWCHICLEDAFCYCVGCDNEPYCKRCWREAHMDDEDMREHQTVALRGR